MTVDVIDFYSPANDRRFPVWTWTPETPGPHPLLFLLHGAWDSGGHNWWQKALAPQAVLAQDLAHPPILVMPTDTGLGLGTAYVDWADGSALVETFLLRELLPHLRETRDLDGRTWITGLSMGGYGAMTLALRHPDLFDSASAMSAFYRPTRLPEIIPMSADRVWGSAVAAHDPSALLLDPPDLRFAFDCGLDDFLLEDNRTMHASLVEAGVDHGYAEHPGGHDWDYWRSRFPDHLRFHARLPGPLS